jgi:iron-sulfur cluster assembly protein
MQVLTVTDRALTQIQTLLESRGKPCLGIRIGVRTRGCSGNAYTLEFADQLNPLDEVVTLGDIKVIVDPKAILFLVGSEMDFVEEKFQSGFTFKNPNEKGRCGCGESFHV